MDAKKLVLAGYHRWRQYLPSGWLYHRDYFAVLALPHSAADSVVETRLRHILHTAARHVPWYRRRVRLSDDELANENVLALLDRFPYIDKRCVMERQRDFLDERLDPRLLAYATSSGSTGLGIGMWRTKRLADIEKAFFVRAWSRYGFSFDKSRYLRIGADSAHPANAAPTRVCGNRLMVSPCHLNPRHRRAIAQAINQFKPRFIHAYPGTVATLLALFEPGELEVDLAAILLASEPVETNQLAEMARLFRCPVSINYGLTERTNLAFGEYRDGQLSDYAFDRLYAVNENSSGEIVGTSLWNDVMPLIRYRTGDYGTIDAGGRCGAIEGREQEFLVDRHGNRISGLAIHIDATTWSFARTYQVRQDRPGAITLVLVPRDSGISPAQLEGIRAAQLARWGGALDISVEVSSEVERNASGKHRFVVSRLQAGH
jgi:phenylacetate-CoA ligase